MLRDTYVPLLCYGIFSRLHYILEILSEIVRLKWLAELVSILLLLWLIYTHSHLFNQLPFTDFFHFIASTILELGHVC